LFPASFSFFLLKVLHLKKKSIIERYTNYQCGPCASLNNSWYNATTTGLIESGSVTHIVYNVNWPGANDPMYLLNAAQNSERWRYYGVNSVPWIVVNGTTVSTSSSSNLINAVNTGNASFAPFKLELVPEIFSNNVISVKVKIVRDPTDQTVFGTRTRLKIGVTEKSVTGPAGALEAVYYDITRRMLPGPSGIQFEIPQPGDSVEVASVYVPSAEFLSSVDLTDIRVVAFIQNDQTKEIYQSEMTSLVSSNNINAAFLTGENLGAAPLTVAFTSYSTATDTTSITQYQWDFDNDGTIDSQDPEPEWIYNIDGSYSVSLTVSDGINQHSTVMKDIVNVISKSADILVVNGLDYSTATYVPEMLRFYGGRAAYGNNQVDVWDLFGDQGFDYLANSQVEKVHLFSRDIPLSVMKLYNKIIWIGNNYSGDLTFYTPARILEYLSLGGNFMLATRYASLFFNTELRDYVGISGFSGDLQVNQINSLDNNLVDMTTMGTNNLVHLFTLSPASEATPIFVDPVTNMQAGFRIQKENEGAFIFISGRPYRYDTSASAANYDYIIQNWMTGQIVGTGKGDKNIPDGFALQQNYPNPFNPATVINYQISKAGFVSIKIFDVLGNEVGTLVNNEMQPGNYQVNFRASGLSSGIYFYRLEAEGINISRKMILMK
jgi:PKD repeat protein